MFSSKRAPLGPVCNKCQKVLIRSGVMKYGFLDSFRYLVKCPFVSRFLFKSSQEMFFLISVFNVAKLTALTQVKLG